MVTDAALYGTPSTSDRATATAAMRAADEAEVIRMRPTSIYNAAQKPGDPDHQRLAKAMRGRGREPAEVIEPVAKRTAAEVLYG